MHVQLLLKSHEEEGPNIHFQINSSEMENNQVNSIMEKREHPGQTLVTIVSSYYLVFSSLIFEKHLLSWLISSNLGHKNLLLQILKENYYIPLIALVNLERLSILSGIALRSAVE